MGGGLSGDNRFCQHSLQSRFLGGNLIALGLASMMESDVFYF
jgi:hypothetical protein